MSEIIDIGFAPRDPNKLSLRTRFYNSRLGRLAIGGLTALGLAAGGVAAEASPAFAATNPVYTVTNHDHDGTHGIYYRNSPSMADSIRQLPYYAKYGDRIELICGTNGEAVGSKNNRRWHLVKDLDNPKAPNQFYIPDHDTNTPNRPNTSTPGERECGSNSPNNLQPAAPLQGNEATPMQTNVYNRQGAVTWAIAHAEDQPPTEGSCTWFVSNALWQGGLAKTTEWTSDGYLGGTLRAGAKFYLGKQALPGTIDAWKAPLLRDYLLATYPHSHLEPIDFSPANNDPKDAQIGDLVFYDWGKGEGVSHVAIVTKIESRGYLDVSDWSTQDDGTMPSPVAMRGVTYSAIRHTWLQKRYPNVKAYLMHIDTTGSPGNP